MEYRGKRGCRMGCRGDVKEREAEVGEIQR